MKKLNLPVDLPFNVVYDCGNVIKSVSHKTLGVKLIILDFLST